LLALERLEQQLPAQASKALRMERHESVLREKKTPLPAPHIARAKRAKKTVFSAKKHE
jgi:hypothetical protein